ncbi:MAG TPA: DUF3857 domain-containing protein [Flavitalea sp.]|nr:DUF3857 domain-containing protein [Flavitalea sp.]
MKLFSILTMLVFSSSIAYSQKNKDIPAFGKIDKTETDLKECEFDKNAGAVVLFDNGKFTTNFVGGTFFSELERHVRIKILNDKGLDQADIKILYKSYKGAEDVRDLSAQTYNVDASGKLVVTKVEKNLIYNKKVSARNSHEIFTFPEVKPGSIIEYKYSVRGAGLQDWHFQQDIPVMLSRYTLEFPTILEIYSEQFGGYQVNTTKTLKGSNNVHTHTIRNLPAFRDEPFISVDDDYLQKLHSTITAYFDGPIRKNLLPNWPDVIKALMEDEDFGLQLKRNIPRTDDLELALKSLNSPYEKMITIHSYVRRNMEWDGTSDIWALDGVKSAWKEKKGNSGEINLILVNLLKDAGLNAQPVLVSTRQNGRISTQVPGIYQFNKVLAHVKIDNRIYVLDGTEKFTASRLIPLDVMYTEGLVVGKQGTNDWGWEVLWDQTKKFNNVTIFQASLDEKGILNGEATITSFDYSRIERMPILKQGKEKFVSHYFESRNPDFKIENVVIDNEDKDSLPLIQQLKFSHPVNESGNYRYFSANLFSGLEKNPFISEERFSDVFFGANQQYSILGHVRIPKGYVFEELPKDLRMIMPDTSITITRQTAVKDNMLSTRIILEFKKPVYTPDEYPYFMEFYKKLFALLNEQFVVKKVEGVVNN